jgi:hypothetical protein
LARAHAFTMFRAIICSLFKLVELRRETLQKYRGRINVKG